MYDGTSRGRHTSSFDGAAARRLREALGMAPRDVAHGMRAAFGLTVAAETVTAWERGEQTPDDRELTALAGALWCAVPELMDTPGTLRGFRLAQGLSRADLALGIGMDEAAYALAEEEGRWVGDARQADALGRVLRLPVPALIAFTGRSAELAELLRRAVTSRWQAYVEPVSGLVPLPRAYLEDGLRRLHAEYTSTTAASLGWGRPASASSREAARAFLDDVLDRFWNAVEGLES
ncbi:transcriptional regulator [Streptomyces sp. NHF165]|uniref:helix-turn-helix domain-containing protein n=1 Tax=Streptomyces TaxID=1883 RepID=UPI00132EB9D7|nr:helix-turn-helix transcriptional regulator [Streptomyces sp. NHF165]QHF96267.1 transcriptional regulator [Streptomyces sp. NHF165]